MAPPPLWDRMTPEQVDEAATLISGGIPVEDAFLGIYPTSTAAIWRALAAGREFSARQEDGGKALTEKDRRGMEFYRKIQQAQARGRMWLYRAAVGIEVVGGDVVRSVKTESPNAMKILMLNSPSLRTPWRDPDELAAIAAHAAAAAGKPTEEPPVEATPQPTEAQREAWLRKEAAALGLTIAPKEPT